MQTVSNVVKTFLGIFDTINLLWFYDRMNDNGRPALEVLKSFLLGVLSAVVPETRQIQQGIPTEATSYDQRWQNQ